MSALETARLRLRLLHEQQDDAALYAHLYTDPAVMARIAAPLPAEAAARAFHAACRHNRKAQPGHRVWAIEEKASAAGLGIAALLRSGERAELGVMLRPAQWNRGIASEAFVPLIDHAFLGMGLALVYAARPDDDHARLIDRLLDRFAFRRAPEHAAPGQARWELPRTRWKALA